MLDSVNEPLDPVSKPVLELIEKTCPGLVDPSRNNDSHMVITKVFSNLSAAIGLVSSHSLRPESRTTSALLFDGTGFHELMESRGLVPFTGSEHEGDKLSAPLGSDMDLGGKSPLAVAQSILLWLALFGSRSMLVGSDDGSIYKVDIPIHFSLCIPSGFQGREDPIPYALIPPAEESAVDSTPGTILLGDIPPGSTRFELPEDSIDDPSVVFIGLSYLRFLRRKEWFQFFPLLIG